MVVCPVCRVHPEIVPWNNATLYSELPLGKGGRLGEIPVVAPYNRVSWIATNPNDRL